VLINLSVFATSAIFEEFYRRSCELAIQNYTNDEVIRKKFIARIQEELALMLSLFESDTKAHSALRQHTDRLTSLWPHFPQLKSSRSCFSCLMLMPEKVFDCHHAVCNPCIKRAGQRSQFENHTFILSACILCGQIQSQSIFRIIPPTAGIRILCIDGGGIRGVIPLTFLQYFGKELNQLGCPLQEFFDYSCGTSAGMYVNFNGFISVNITW